MQNKLLLTTATLQVDNIISIFLHLFALVLHIQYFGWSSILQED